jgi:hypothetical protein
MGMASKTMKLQIEFDTSEGTEEVSRFLGLMMDAGYEPQVRECAKQLLAEAEKRGLPIAQRLKAAIEL